MKKILFLLFFSLIAAISFADDTESTTPSYNTEIQRSVSIMDIEGTLYHDVVVTMKSNEPDYVFVTKGKVSVHITSDAGQTIYKKKFKDAYLYIFRNGQIQIGKKNFDKLVIYKSSTYPYKFSGIIREKEGVY